MTKIYSEQNGDLDYLTGKQVAMIGYVGMGRPIALNLRDSGIRVVVGVYEKDSGPIARADGLRTATIETAVQECDVLMLLLPDEAMPQVYLERISPYLRKGHTLIFTSGYNIAYGYIEAPPFVDVGLVAPRILGASIRERYLNNKGFYSFVAVGQDSGGQAWPTILAIAKAIGSLRAGAIEVSIEQETELDLFIQQAILPAVHHIMLTAARLLIRMGYPSEAALTDLYLSGEFTDYLQRAADAGLLHALRLSSLTGQYGIFSRLNRFNDLKLERLMEVTLDEIRDGDFAREWSKEYADGYSRLKKLLKNQEDMDLWELEQQALDLLHGI